MKFISMVRKEVLHNFRDAKAMFMMIVFPILMIVILGTAFSGNFNSSNIIKGVQVSYNINVTGDVEDGFKDFMTSLSEQLDITFTEVKDEKVAKKDLKDGIYDGYIVVDKDQIRLFVNSLRVYNANLIQTVMKSYVDKSNLIAEVVSVAPEKVAQIMPEGTYSPDYLHMTSIEAQEVPSSKDYYAVTMFTMIILYSTNIGAFAIIAEKIRKTYQRIMCSNVSRISFILAKVLGCFLITCLQVLIVYLVSKYMLRANWGTSPAYILLISGSLVFMSVSVGVGLSEGIKSPALMAAFLNMTIPVFVFLAGGYIPLSVFNSSVLNTIASVSPLKWTNQAMFDLIYLNSTSVIPTTVIINVAVGVGFLLIPIIKILVRKDVA